MTLKEFYTAIGGDYFDVLERLRNEQLIRKFVLKFSDDKNFEILCKSLNEGDKEEAFRAAHTIKGVCQNLSFTRLEESSSMITEALRGGDLAGALALLNRLREDYKTIVSAIQALEAEISQ